MSLFILFLFILFITYAFHYLFAKTGRAVPALEVAELQQSCRPQDTATVTRMGTAPRERITQQAQRQEGTSWKPGALRPASILQRQSPSPFVCVAAPCPAPAVGTNQPILCNVPAEHPWSKRRACGIPERGPTRASASYLGSRAATAPSPRAGPRYLRDPTPAPRGARVPPTRSLPAPSSSLQRLPPAASVLPLLAGSAPPRGCPCHGLRCRVPRTPRRGRAAPRPRRQPPAHSSSAGFPRGAGAAPRLCPRLSCK